MVRNTNTLLNDNDDINHACLASDLKRIYLKFAAVGFCYIIISEIHILLDSSYYNNCIKIALIFLI